MKKEKKQDSFQNELSRFMDKAGPFTHAAKKVKTLQKSEVRCLFCLFLVGMFEASFSGSRGGD